MSVLFWSKHILWEPTIPCISPLYRLLACRPVYADISIPPSHVFLSDRLCQIYFILNVSPAALNCWSDWRRLMTKAPCFKLCSDLNCQPIYASDCPLRSSSVRNFAVSGKSWITQKEAMPTRTVRRPSMMNIQAQAGFPPMPSILAMAAASRPPITYHVNIWVDFRI